MNIKGLLLGSAAALVAVSGARAADAVVIAEPEPFEYVRICDTYGAGFYYIPGTETCLKISGYVRHDIGVGVAGLQDVVDKEWLYDFITSGEGSPDDLIEFDPETNEPTYLGKTNDTYYKRTRFVIRTDARQETELGTLRAYAQLRFNYTTGVGGLGGISAFNLSPLVEELGAVYVAAFSDLDVTTSSYGWDFDHAYIELGGFRIGTTDSLFTTFTGYAGSVITDGIVGYGPFNTHQIAYTFTGGNGFTAAVALETGTGWGALDSDTYPLSRASADFYAIDDYVPHIVGGVGYTAGWGGISGVVGYDSVWETWAAKARVDFNVNDAISLFVMGGIKDDDSAFNYYGPWSGDWAVWGGGSWQFNEKATANLQVSYDDGENLGVVANVAYELVNNFVITPELIYEDTSSNDDEWGGFLRFQMNWGG